MNKIELPRISDPRGNLSFFEGESQIPFQIKRVYWVYDVPGGEVRGGHAFRTQQEFIICLSGSVFVNIDDGKETKQVYLCRSYYGLYVPHMHWRSFSEFSTNAVVLIAASSIYNDDDYIRDYSIFSNESK